jgi:prephenate dehydrogenase
VKDGNGIMASTVLFRRVAIIGTGLIGGSFALALRQIFPTISLVGFSRSGSCERARDAGVVDEATPDLAAAVSGADLVYIALPIGASIESLGAIAKSAEPHALVTDACSTKTVICRAAKDHFQGRARFFGAHPMAGKEQSGVEHADAKLFRRAPYALMGTETEADARVQAFVEIVRSIGARPIWSDPETHDWAVGIVSHLPQLVSLALARVVQDETDETGLPLSLSGSGLRDMLRLAGSPYDIWRDILLTNTENISRALDRLAQAIDYLRTNLASKEIQQEFTSANDLYRQLHKPS